jgi:type 1 glutamine amidotransferase
MAKTLPDDQKELLKAFVEKGKGVVLLHHALCSYDSWPWWWQEATGGHYFIDSIPGHPASTYQHDEEMLARPVKGREDHPILRGIGPLQLNDETYHGMWLSPKATVLMEIEHPRNDRALVYIGPNPVYRVVTIQLGHSEGTLRDPNYRKLVHNAILWSAGK